MLKRSDYGFNGYQRLVIPQAPRSARRRRSFAKKDEDNQMSAFDLLATVAGKLLLETESNPMFSNTSTVRDKCTTTIVENVVKKEHQDEEKPLKIEPYDQSELVSQVHDQNYGLKESQDSQNNARSGLSSALTSSESSERVCAGKMEIDGSISKLIGCKVEGGSPAYSDTGDCKLESEIKIPLKNVPHNMPVDITADKCSLENPGKPPAGASSDSSSKGPLCKEHVPCLSYNPSSSRYPVNLVCRDDDDENSSGCTHPSKAMGCTHRNRETRFFRPSPRIGDRRIRKLLASRYWKVAPKSKNGDLQNTVFLDRELKSAYRNRKNCYKRQRSQRNYPFKKRKIFYHSSISNSNGGVSNDGISNLLKKDINGDSSSSDLKMHAATGKSSSVAGQHSSFQCRDSHVKLRIQSFRVPELFIEIPETATVGSLKRTVMEAVNAILGGGGLHVGLLLQGKKVRDDHKTLQQTGISRDKHLEALGFTLEPTLSQVSPHLGPEDPPSDTPQPLTRYPAESGLVHKGTTGTSPELHVANLGNFVESDHDSAPSPNPIGSSIDKNTADSKSLVALPAIGVEALSMVPAHHKSKRSEFAQRRIRRPFSVTEVEALVQAVEKLGTGRWRDVKVGAFENAKHRTYVDLKDKWKTLVHTARISPQQRRGEAVPQELLDRVLAAHAYWTKQHLKQQQQQQETFLLL